MPKNNKSTSNFDPVLAIVFSNPGSNPNHSKKRKISSTLGINQSLENSSIYSNLSGSKKVKVYGKHTDRSTALTQTPQGRSLEEGPSITLSNSPSSGDEEKSQQSLTLYYKSKKKPTYFSKKSRKKLTFGNDFNALPPLKNSHKTHSVCINKQVIDAVSKTRDNPQNAVMDNISANNYASSLGLSVDGEHQWQWLHLIAHCFGGLQAKQNLVLGSYECNRSMMHFEKTILDLIRLYHVPTIALQVIADLMPDVAGDDFTHAATQIWYKIICNGKSMAIRFNPRDHSGIPESYSTDLRNVLCQFFQGSENTTKDLPHHNHSVLKIR